MPGTLKAGRIFGVDINLHWSWVLILALVTVTFAEGVIADAFPDWGAELRWPAGLAVAAIFFASLLAHEMSHSIVARRLGIPVSSITLFIFGGSSNLEKDADTAQQEVQIAVVGPLTSLLVGTVFGICAVALDGAGSGLADVAAYLAFINTAIAIFNLIPAFPMDGGRLLRGFLWSRGGNVVSATRLAAAAGEAFSLLFMGAGIALMVFVDIVSGIWLLLIGNFMRSSSSQGYAQVVLDKVIKDVPAEAVSRKDFATIGPEATLEELVEHYFLAGPARCLPVTVGQELLGLVTLSDVTKVQRDAWPVTTAFRAMTPLGRLQTVSPKDGIASVLSIMADHSVNQVPVVDGHRLVGMIERSDVIAYIQTRSELTDFTHRPPTKLAAVGGGLR